MLLLRLVAVLSVIAIGAGIVLFLATRDRKYLRFAGLTAKWAILFALLVMAMFALERVAVL